MSAQVPVTESRHSPHGPLRVTMELAVHQARGGDRGRWCHHGAGHAHSLQGVTVELAGHLAQGSLWSWPGTKSLGSIP